jgi:Tfp pilus assembly protein PilF
MRNITIILLVAAALVLTVASGCDVGGSRKQGAAVRWEQTMDQVRLDAARESLAQGRYEYARKVLEPCMKSPCKQQDAERLMAKIEEAHQVYAQLSSYRDSDNKERAY